MTTAHPYLSFWSKIFNLTSDDLLSSQCAFVTEGHYVEKYTEAYVFFYEDLQNGKKVIAGSTKNIAAIKTNLSLAQLSLTNADNIRDKNYFQNLNIAFKDMDFILSQKSMYTPVTTNNYDIRELQASDVKSLETFYSDCSEDDKDTLDLTFEKDTALGLYENDMLSGVARYTLLKDTELADITILVRNGARGRGLSIPLVSKLIEDLLLNGYYPKYRVEENNSPSIAIAKKLGLTPAYRLLAWDTSHL